MTLAPRSTSHGAAIANLGAAIANLGAVIANLGAAIAKLGAAIANLGAVIANLGAAAPSHAAAAPSHAAAVPSHAAAAPSYAAAAPSMPPRQVRISSRARSFAELQSCPAIQATFGGPVMMDPTVGHLPWETRPPGCLRASGRRCRRGAAAGAHAWPGRYQSKLFGRRKPRSEKLIEPSLGPWTVGGLAIHLSSPCCGSSSSRTCSFSAERVQKLDSSSRAANL
jgi:hypothetical protein